MSNTIQVKRGVEASIPALGAGEFGFCTDTFKLFIGSSGGNKQVSTAGGVVPHEMVNGIHTDSGLTVGHVIRASGASAFAWAQLGHGDLSGVTASQHHSETHVLATTGPHTGSLPWSDLSKTGSDLADLAAKAHSSLTGVSTSQHHTKTTDNEVYGLIERVGSLPGAGTLDRLVFLTTDDVLYSDTGAAWEASVATPSAHAIVGTKHTASGLTVGYVIRATGATTFAWSQLGHGDLSGVTSDQHHNEGHIMSSIGPHAESGLTAGHVLRASAGTAFSFTQLQHADLGGVTADLHHAHHTP